MRNTTRRRILQGAAGLAAATALMPSPLIAANNPLQIGIVGKVKIPWFDNVAKGVEKAGTDLGVTASIINPTTDDPAEQVRLHWQLIGGLQACKLLPPVIDQVRSMERWQHHRAEIAGRIGLR